MNMRDLINVFNISSVSLMLLVLLFPVLFAGQSINIFNGEQTFIWPVSCDYTVKLPVEIQSLLFAESDQVIGEGNPNDLPDEFTICPGNISFEYIDNNSITGPLESGAEVGDINPTFPPFPDAPPASPTSFRLQYGVPACNLIYSHIQPSSPNQIPISDFSGEWSKYNQSSRYYIGVFGGDSCRYDFREGAVGSATILCGVMTVRNVNTGDSSTGSIDSPTVVSLNMPDEGDYTVKVDLTASLWYVSQSKFSDPSATNIYTIYNHTASPKNIEYDYTVHVRNPQINLTTPGWLGDLVLNPGDCTTGIIPITADSDQEVDLYIDGITVTSTPAGSVNLTINDIDPNEYPTDTFMPISPSNPILVHQGETVQLNVTLCASPSFNPSEPISIHFDYTNASTLCNSQSTTLDANIDFSPSPDYISRPLPAYTSAVNGDTINVDVSTTNQGGAGATVNSRTRAHVEYESGITHDYYQNVAPLGPGALQNTPLFNVTCPYGDRTSWINITTCADWDGVIDEDGFEDNNCNTTTITCLPNLINLYPECPSDFRCNTGHTYNLNFDTYAGDICVGGESTTYLEVYDSSNTLIDSVSWPVPALPNNDSNYLPPGPPWGPYSPPPGMPSSAYCVNITPSMTRVESFNMPFGGVSWRGNVLDRWNPYSTEYSFTPTVAGTYRFYVMADYNHDITEGNEFDNGIWCNYTCSDIPYPDLVPSCENVTGNFGESVVLDYNITNQGAEWANESWASISIGGYQWIPELNPGDTVTEQVPITCWVPGTTYYTVTADFNNTINETTAGESNNVIPCMITCNMSLNCIDFV